METLRILVTDDEPGMRHGVARILGGTTLRVPDVDEEFTLEVEQSETGEAALEIVRRQPPDILLLDHKMPGMSGLDVLDALAAMRLDMLTIMITAYASIETAVLATKRGAYDFLAKPFTPEELKATLRKTAAHLLLAKRARQLAEERRHVRFEFVRVLGHELKSPLAAVTSYVDVMRQHALGDQLADYDDVLKRCRTRLEGMDKMIHDLLDLTRIESGQKTRSLAPVDLAERAQAALDGVRATAAARGIELHCRAEGAGTMTADTGELEMILNNLVSNAVKYNREGGRVEVAIVRRAGRVEIAVTDTGIGMSAEAVARLFGEFVRIRTADTAHIEGTGLGLSIVRKLAQLYDGRVAVVSEPGHGTTVTVVLRDAAENAVATEPA